MKFSCEKNVMTDAVGKVIRTVPLRASAPVLEGLLIELEKDGSLRLVGTDTELSIETYINVQTDGACSFVAPAKKFFEMLAKLDSGEILFELDDRKVLHISSGLIKYDLPTMDAEIFPAVPMVEKGRTVVLKESALGSMIRQTLFSAADGADAVKPVLKGAYFEIGAGKITVVASDLFRMAIRTEPFESGTDEPFSFIVPHKTLSELIKIMQEPDEDVRIGIASTHVVIEFENTRITSRLISGEYINYKALLGRTYKTTVRVACADVVRAVDRASVIITDKIRSSIRVSFEYDSIVFYCRTAEGESFTDEISAERSGEGVEMAFKGRYLVDAMNGGEIEKVCIQIDSPRAPICVKPEDDERFLYIISPMRVEND